MRRLNTTKSNSQSDKSLLCLIAYSFTQICNAISHHTQSIFFLTGLNIFSQGPWKEIQDRLKSSHGEVTSVELFKGLQQTALSSKACGTVVNYTSSLYRWVKFVNTNKLVVFPVSVVDAALFFSHLAWPPLRYQPL